MNNLTLRALLLSAMLASASAFAHEGIQLGTSGASQPTSHAERRALPPGRRQLPLQPVDGEMIPAFEPY